MVYLMLLTIHPLGMNSLSFVVILRHVAFEENMKNGFLLFHVVVNNNAVEFQYAFESDWSINIWLVNNVRMRSLV